MIELKDIQVKYEDFIAVDQVNLRIKAGEFFTLLGPSGCGKTTTLRAIAGLTQPTKGQVIIDKQDITHIPAEKRNIGMVFQSYALFPTMTVFDNIAYGLKVDKVPAAEIRRKVEEQAEVVELSLSQLRKNVSQLSGGQQQRVAIARTLVKAPRVILFDEPLSNLDAKLRKQLRSELKAIQAKTGLTAVYVTHDQEEALELSDRIAVFQNGHIDQIGSPIEVYNHSATEFVCNFIGDVNRLSQKMVASFNQRIDKKVPQDEVAYIRWENIRSQRFDANDINVEGTIVEKKFQGDRILYQAEILGDSLSFLELNHPAKSYHIGEKISLFLTPEDILHYPIGGEAIE